jgi:hypothetical protein
MLIIDFLHSIFKEIVGIPSYNNRNVENSHNLNISSFYYHIGAVKYGYA